MTDQIQLVFRGNVTPQQALQRTDDAIFTLPMLKLSPFYKVSEQHPYESIEIHRWKQDGEKATVIDLTIDQSIPMAFVSVLSDSSEQAIDAAEKLNELLRLPPASEFIREAIEHPQDGASLLRAATASGSQEDQQLKDLVLSGLQSADRPRREAAIKSAALLTWSSLLPALHEAFEQEEDPMLKRFLLIACKDCGG
jgi:hypothetical protein